MSTLKAEERNQIVLDFVGQHKRLNVNVFHLRWNEPDLLTDKVLMSTPPFWYKKYGWRRKHVENLFYEAQIEMSYLMISAFDEVYGAGYKGKRWRYGALRGKLDNLWERLYGKKPSANDKNKKSKTQKNQQINFEAFLQALTANNVTISNELARSIFNQIDGNKNGFITKEEMDQYLAKLDDMNLDDVTHKQLLENAELLNLVMAKKALQCVLSEEGLTFVEADFIAALKAEIAPLNFEAFLKCLGENNVTISNELARNIFDAIDDNKTGFITKQEMEEYLSKLENMDLVMGDVSTLANDQKMLNLVMAKHVLECILSEQGLEFVDTKFIMDLQAKQDLSEIDAECVAYLNKMCDRDTAWEERVFAMNAIHEGLASSKYDKVFISDDLIRQLLLGLAAQILDKRDEVRSKAIELAPDILNECFQKASNVAIVYEHLDDIIANLFKVLDNPKWKKNHQNVKFGIDELIDMIINTQQPIAALILTKIFANACDIGNVTSADGRHFALQCVGKILFSLQSPYLEFDVKQAKAPKVDESMLPPVGDAYREWLDIATNNQEGGPSQKYMQRMQDKQIENVHKFISGEINESSLGYASNNEDDDEKDVDKIRTATAPQIGSDFIDVVSDALSVAMFDPNRNNKIHAFKTNDILQQLHKGWGDHLNKESKQRYDQWKSGRRKPPSTPPPEPYVPNMKRVDIEQQPLTIRPPKWDF
eukprot:232109_1